MSVRIDKGRLGGGLDLTPMIDIVFLLMIFFLVASKLEEDDRAIDVILPQASAAKPLTTRPREFIINIDRGGNTYAGARPVAAGELVGLLRQAVADNPGRQKVTVRADENVAHKHVVAVMDACVQAGIEDYRVQSAPVVSGDRAAGPDDRMTPCSGVQAAIVWCARVTGNCRCSTGPRGSGCTTWRTTQPNRPTSRPAGPRSSPG